MKAISNQRIFWLSALLGMSFAVASAAYSHRTHPRLLPHRLTDDVWVSEQLRPNAIPEAKARGFATIIDLRPDGEAANQPSSAAMEEAARANALAFAYVPVPHGDIPEDAVTVLGERIASSPKPILLYCRSGRRAVRTWSLAEASRPSGLAPEQIEAAARSAGQSAEDLDAGIRQRIAARPVAEPRP